MRWKLRSPDREQSVGKHHQGASFVVWMNCCRDVSAFLCKVQVTFELGLLVWLPCCKSRAKRCEIYTNIQRKFYKYGKINTVDILLWSCRYQRTQRNWCKLHISADEPVRIIENHSHKIIQIFDLKHQRIKCCQDIIFILQISVKEFMGAEHRCWWAA